MGFPLFRPNRLVIDPGTSNTQLYVSGNGIVVDEPSVIALPSDNSGRKNAIIAVGREAQQASGRSPSTIKTVSPFDNGAILDYDAATAMFRYFIGIATGGTRFFSPPHVMIPVRVSATSVERRALQHVARAAGATRIHLVDQPVAAALGAGLPVTGPVGSMIVTMGSSETESAVISLGTIVQSRSVAMGGNAMDELVIDYMRHRHGLLIAKATAEALRISAGAAAPSSLGRTCWHSVTGIDSHRGVPAVMQVSTEEISSLLTASITTIADTILATLETLLPELASDIIGNGITLCGGIARTPGLADSLADLTGIPCTVAENPLHTVVRGCGQWLDTVADTAQPFLSPKPLPFPAHGTVLRRT